MMIGEFDSTKSVRVTACPTFPRAVGEEGEVVAFNDVVYRVALTKYSGAIVECTRDQLVLDG